jgi:hypothetical protein
LFLNGGEIAIASSQGLVGIKAALLQQRSLIGRSLMAAAILPMDFSSSTTVDLVSFHVGA